MKTIDKTLAGKVFLLTGGSSGVGKATALSLAQKGQKSSSLVARLQMPRKPSVKLPRKPAMTRAII